MYSKGQVSTEYLVILAVVLVVALVVVYLVGGFASLGTASLSTQSMNYWGGASPMAITAVKVSGTNVTLQMVNDGLQPVTITEIDMINATIGIAGAPLTFNSGASSVVTGNVPAGSACGSAGTPFSYGNVTIIYTQGTITAIKESGLKPLVGTCS
jgi:uncharacterized protein (UPF0333 family)